ncbi:MAG: acyl-CoA synthetase (AMP-forming)/AMP-acid ligase II [Planctomycetota bacterium]|jgi:acyl-CoA synthetase (AMP-forming)/AMP-acid ligase II
MPHTVSELLDHASQRFGAQPFLSVGDDSCTFAWFERQVRSAAALLLARGMQPGDRVAVLLPRSTHETVFLLASMLAGGIAVPVHGKLKDDQVQHVLEDSTPRFVITSPARTVALRDAEVVLRGYQLLDVAEVDLQATVTHLAGHGDVVAATDDGAQPAVLLYTSGSTGQAKGIVQTQSNLLLGARVVVDYLKLGPADHLLALLSFSFDYGLNQLLCALHAGCQLTTADHLSVFELASLLLKYRPTGLAGVPSLWHEVAEGLTSGLLTEQHGRSLRYITNSGGALRPEDASVMRKCWPHLQVFAMYGLTEAFRSAFLPPVEFDEHPDSFGYAIDGVELLLVGPEDGLVLEGAATGELVHAGALVASGYWRRPDADAVRFRPDPRAGCFGTVVYSGDLVRRDEAGRHYFVSRRDRMLKVHGHRVSPDEVSQSIASMDGVGEVCVFGIDGGADGHHIVLCFAGDIDDEDLLAAVRRRCRARLPSYMLPKTFRVMSSLPHNANGKVDESALRAMLA